eukprot:s271_g9.t1
MAPLRASGWEIRQNGGHGAKPKSQGPRLHLFISSLWSRLDQEIYGCLHIDTTVYVMQPEDMLEHDCSAIDMPCHSVAYA